jgi:hypothetical protein
VRKVSQLEHAKITIEEAMTHLFPDQYLWTEEGKRKARTRNTPLPGMGARGLEAIKFTMV